MGPTAEEQESRSDRSNDPETIEKLIKYGREKIPALKNAKVVGADINELAPIKGFNSYNFLVAKLAYKILSYKFLC